MKNTTVILRVALGLALLAGLWSCGGEDYDLSDIDTHARISVHNLKVPLNVSPVRMESMLDIKDGDRVRKDTLPNGAVLYAIRETGSFRSSSIPIDPFTLKECNRTASAGLGAFGASPAAAGRYVSELPASGNTLTVENSEISPDILGISSLGLESSMTLTLDLSSLRPACSSVEIKNLQISFLKGLTVSNLTISDKNGNNAIKATYLDGVISAAHVPSNSDFVFVLHCDIERIDVAESGAVFEWSSQGSSFSLSTDVKILGGTVEVESKQIHVAPEPVQLVQNLLFTAGRVVSFSGEIAKKIDIDLQEDIDLSHLPDILSETGTNLVLSNPQLTLNINNPLIQKGYKNVYVQAGLSLTGNMTFATASDAIKLRQASNTIVISSDAEAAGEDHVCFDGLARILAGDGVTQGIPRSVKVEVTDVEIPRQTISNYLLGAEGRLEPVEGTWEFFAPLALTSSSCIKYTQTWTDWDTEDLEDFVVTGAGVALDITNLNVPLQIESMSFVLNGLSGRLSGTSGSSPAAGETGTIQLDLAGMPLRQPTGATLEVRLKGGNDPLQPSHSLVINKATLSLSGYYETEL